MAEVKHLNLIIELHQEVHILVIFF